MRVTFFGCKKSNQKCALQTAAIRGAGRRGLGVGCQASGFDCGSFCPYRVFRFGTRVTKRSRLRWLSERGCIGPACTDRPGMLKWAPDPGGLAVPSMVLPITSFSVGRGRIRDGMPVSTICVGDATPTYERRQDWFAMSATVKSKNTDRNQARIPLTADTETRFSIHRSPPRPAIVPTPLRKPSKPESIHRPGAKAEHDKRTRRSQTSAVIKHLTPAPVDPQLNSLLLVRSAFACFSGACEK